MIEPGALLAWSALALVVTLTPGPDTLLVAAHAARGGFRTGMTVLAGTMTGVAWYAVLIAFGALSVLVAAPPLFLAVKVAGALYLAWLGAGMIWRAWKGEGEKDKAPSKSIARLTAPFAQGFFTNALNPKVAFFFLAALPQFASGPDAPAIGVMLVAIHGAMGFVWLAFVAFAASRARTIAWNSSFGRWLEGAVGAFFVGLAARLALAQR